MLFLDRTDFRAGDGAAARLGITENNRMGVGVVLISAFPPPVGSNAC